jgi:hypothetical protein
MRRIYLAKSMIRLAVHLLWCKSLLATMPISSAVSSQNVAVFESPHKIIANRHFAATRLNILQQSLKMWVADIFTTLISAA